jgi:hypothetical protein
MSVSQIAMVGAAALIAAPLVAAAVLIAVGSRARPRYARALSGIDERDPSVPCTVGRSSPESMVHVVLPLGTPAPKDLGHQALRDVVDVQPRHGTEVLV